MPVFNDTCPGQSRQLQFSDKDADVPVFMHLWWSRQCVSDKDADVPVVVHDRCQIQLDRFQQLVF